MATPSLHIAYLLSKFPAVNHTYLLREVRGLRARGFQVHVASVSRPDRPPEQLAPEELEEMRRACYVKASPLAAILAAHLATLILHPIGYLQGLCCPLRMGRGDWRKTLSLLFYFLEAVVVGRWMERNRLTHLHSHFSSTVGLIAARVFPITVSFTFHGPSEFYDPAGFWLLEKIRAARFVCAISAYGRSRLLRVCPSELWDKIEVVPLGVDPAEFPPRPFRAQPDRFELLCAGRLAPEKAQRVLLAALESLAPEHRDFRLHLAGDGPDRPALEREVAARGLAQRVVFEGWLDQERLRSLYRSTDILVLPSFAEGLPVVLMEAMAMEIPCVATQIAGIPELIQSGQNGLLVPPSDHRELARAIACLMDDAELRRRLGRAARERVLREYDLTANISRLAEVFSRRLVVPDLAG